MEPIFRKTEETLIDQGFEFERKDLNRPWGAFWVIEENQAEKFVEKYFPDLDLKRIANGQKVSPKILLVRPKQRLSWQYHFRRSEVWRVVDKPVGIMRSETDEQTEVKTYIKGDLIILEKGERHRLVGLEDWGIVAEIWIHTEPDNPSNENDIVRLQDDYKRETPK